MTFSLGLVACEGRKAELLKTFRALLRPIRGSGGCLKCSLLEDVQQSDEISLVVHWSSSEDFERYVKSESFRQVLAGMELSAKPPELQIRSVASVRGIDLLREILECEDD